MNFLAEPVLIFDFGMQRRQDFGTTILRLE